MRLTVNFIYAECADKFARESHAILQKAAGKILFEHLVIFLLTQVVFYF